MKNFNIVKQILHILFFGSYSTRPKISNDISYDIIKKRDLG